MSGPLPGALSPLTWLASRVYGAMIAARNRRYDAGRGVESLPVPVISVGNLTAGGAGKSPTVRWIAGRLAAHGVTAVIAMRGYRAPEGGRSDEQLEHETAAPGVPVVAEPDRTAALRRFLPNHPRVGCVILDDGFQHRRLSRQLDLVLIDATRDTLRDALLPHGWLREPPSALRRADAVLVTRAADVCADLATAIERCHGRPPIAWSRHTWRGVTVYQGTDGPRTHDIGWLEGRRVVTLLGVGNPQAVRKQVESAGAVIAVDIPARDHEAYGRSQATLARGLCDGLDAMVMTPKDWVKFGRLIDLGSWPVPIAVPQLEIEVFEGADALEARILQAVSCRN